MLTYPANFALNFGLSIHLHPCTVYASSSEGSLMRYASEYRALARNFHYSQGPTNFPHLQQHLLEKQLCNLSRKEALVHTGGEVVLGFCWVVFIRVTPKLLSLMNFNESFQL